MTHSTSQQTSRRTLRQSSRYSIHADAIARFLEGAEAHGLNVEKLLAGVGEPPDFFSLANRRLESDKVGRLIRRISLSLQDESLGFLTRKTGIGGFELAIQSALHGKHLGDAIQRMAKVWELMHDDIRLSISDTNVEQGKVAIELMLGNHQQSCPSAGNDIFIMLVYVFLVRWMAWVTNRSIYVDALSLTCHRPHYAGDLTSVFPCDHQYDAVTNQLVFDKAYLKLPLARWPQDVPAFLRTLPALLNTKTTDPRLSTKVAQALRDSEHFGQITLAAVADSMNKSTQTLRRYLKREGTNFAALKESVRRERAMAALDEGQQSIKQIAFDIGFSEPSAFIRAFKHWTGLTPGEYRQQQGKS